MAPPTARPCGHGSSLLQGGAALLLSVPEGYEIVLGTAAPPPSGMWPARASWTARGLSVPSIQQSSPEGNLRPPAHALIDEAEAVAPWSRSHQRDAAEHVDVYAYPHNETSTGVAPRLPGRRPGAPLVDGTSIAVPRPWTSPESTPAASLCKGPLGSDGGLWVAVLSPAAIERARRIEAAPRPLDPAVPVAVCRD